MNDVTEPELVEAIGWYVIDPDGNVIDSGPVLQLEAVSESTDAEQEQQ